VNTLLDNWDAYGAMAHNYYLYGDPKRNGKLVWIPWDHNESFATGRSGRGGFGRGGGDVMHQNAGSNWPLYSLLLSDPVYLARYKEWLAKSIEGLGSSEAFAKRARTLHALITPAIIGKDGETANAGSMTSAESFAATLNALIQSVTQRGEAIRSALASR
jgi:hypothetical protein